MKMSYNEAKKVILSRYKDSNIIASYKMEDGYLFSIKPKTWKKEDMILDALFRVRDNGKIEEYSPVMNVPEFKKALNNRIE